MWAGCTPSLSNSPGPCRRGKQLIWMYYLDDLEDIKKKDLDALVATKLNPIIDAAYPGFQAAPKWQKHFYSEATSHNG